MPGLFGDETGIPALVQVAVQTALQRSLARGELTGTAVPQGTVQEAEPNETYQVVMDGDSESQPMFNVTGLSLQVGNRVSVVFARPHKPLIIGVAQPYSRAIVPPFVSTANTGTLSASANTDMVLNDVPVIVGRTVALHLKVPSAEFATVAGTARWVLRLQIDGANVDQFRQFQAPPGAYRDTISSWCFWTPSISDQVQFLVRADEVVDGSTLTLEASTTAPRSLHAFDWGYMAAAP